MRDSAFVLLVPPSEAAQMDSVRALLPRFEAKIHRVLDRVWGVAT